MPLEFPEFLVLDGGLGTEIIRRNSSNLTVYNLSWTLRMDLLDEGLVETIQREFLEAGADLIITNTYRQVPHTIMKELSVDYATAIEQIQSQVRMSCEIRDTFWDSVKSRQPDRIRPLVVASLAQFGVHIPTATDYQGTYIDNTSIEEMVSGFRDKAVALYESGADILAFETIPATKEAEAICRLMNEMPDGAKAWVAFCCKDGEHVGHGEKFSDAVLATLNCDAVVGVGVNCSAPENVTSLLKQIPDVIKKKKRIVVYPNNGTKWDTVNKKWILNSDFDGLDKYVDTWMRLGANWIGGCCYVTADHVADIKKKMTDYRSKIQ